MDDVGGPLPGIRHLFSPLTREQLRPLEPGCGLVQLNQPLTDAELDRVAALLGRHPRAGLRVYGRDLYPTLDFLEHFPKVRNVQLDIFGLQDISGLLALRPDLRRLGLGATRRRVSLRPLERFPRLRDLWLEGHARDFEVVGGMRALRKLSLHSITLPNLDVLRPLRALEELEIKLGGTTNIKRLPEIGRLRYFEAYLVRGLADLRPLGGLPSLEAMLLQALPRVKELPSFRRLKALRRVVLTCMKGLTDLAPVAEAPGLEVLCAFEMNHLRPEAFRPFVGHPTLREAAIALGGRRKDASVSELLRLPLPV